jgi:hypothetical protein
MNSATAPSSLMSNVVANSKTLSSKLSSNVGGNLGLIIMVVILFSICVWVLMYIYSKYNSTSLKTVTILSKPFKVSELKNVTANTKIPTLNNGKEFSYSFWVYIDGDNMQKTLENKLVMGRMMTRSVGDASNLIVLDKNRNAMHVWVKTDGKQVYTLNEIDPARTDKGPVLTIPYVPLQRWVNFIVVVDNNFVQIFMDGELREVKDLSNNNGGVVATPNGNLMVGGDASINSFEGYLSKIQAFNYAVTIEHAKLIYKAGPLDQSFLSKVGVGNYTIRSPFVRVDETAEVQDCSKD